MANKRPQVSVDGWGLEQLAGLGLWIDESPDPEQPHEAAIARVCGALVHAVSIALIEEQRGDECNPDGWVPSRYDFTPNEAAIALGGIATLLRELPRMAGDLRLAKPFPDCDDPSRVEPQEES